MNTAFMEWLHEKAGLSFLRFGGENYHITPSGIQVDIETNVFRFDHFPLLIQSAIEGVNATYQDGDKYLFCIHQEEWGIVVIDETEKSYESGFGNCKDFYMDTENKSWLSVKETALKYIYEKEINNE